MKNTDNTIVIDGKIENHTGDLDADMYVDILGQKRVDAAYEEFGVNVIDKGQCGENYPMKIKDLKEIIRKFEEAGCNYISIDYNCDHPDYTLNGVDIHPATESDIEDVNEQEKKEKLKKSERLRKQAENFLNEAKKLEE